MRGHIGVARILGQRLTEHYVDCRYSTDLRFSVRHASAMDKQGPEAD